MNDRHVAPALIPKATEKELNAKFTTRSKLTAGQVMCAVHNYLPFRMSLTELGLEEVGETKDDPIKTELRIKRKIQIENFLQETFGREVFWNAEVPHEWNRYRYDANGSWSFIMGWLYAKDEKTLMTVKLAFGG